MTRSRIGPRTKQRPDTRAKSSLSSFDTLNGVPYSSYLKAVFNYAMGTGGANWEIIGQPTVAVLTELVSGH